MRRIAAGGTVHFAGSGYHTLCGANAFDASLSGLAVPVMRETRDRVNCLECAKLYCAVKNAPWNEVDTDILTRAAYMAPAL